MSPSNLAQADVVWRMYCSGAMLHHVQARYPDLSVDAIHSTILVQHERLTTTSTWYDLDRCQHCGDATCPDWGGRFRDGRMECLACGLTRWLAPPIGASHDLAALRTLAEEVG